MKSDNLFLIGPMGAGKTTIGRVLADSTGKRFIDSDAELEQRTGASIDLIFEIEGEAGFRVRECRLIEELTELDGIVLSSGGGAVLDAGNRRNLKERGVVIYLQVSSELLLKRTERDKKRPLLQTPDRLGRIRELMEIRGPLYEETADLIINTDNQSVKQIVNDICRKAGEYARTDG